MTVYNMSLKSNKLFLGIFAKHPSGSKPISEPENLIVVSVAEELGVVSSILKRFRKSVRVLTSLEG